jgi:putative flippase GtrA
MISTSERVVRFCAVGLIGVPVQIGVLGLLTHVLSLNYLASTAIAVEAAVIHNFLWHDRWTWACRNVEGITPATRLRRFWKFNLSTGVLSILTNLLMTGALVNFTGMPYVVANLLAIASGSAATYITGDIFVFRATKTQCS